MGHWKAVAESALKDLDLVVNAATLGDDSPVPSGSVSEAADRLYGVISALPWLDFERPDSADATVEAIMYYLGYREGVLTRVLPFRPNPRDLQVPARHVFELVNGEKTLAQVLREADAELDPRDDDDDDEQFVTGERNQ